MAKTKNTPNKGLGEPSRSTKTVCAFCLATVDSASMKEHLLACYNKRVPCTICHKTFKDKTYLKKHQRIHFKNQTVAKIAQSLPNIPFQTKAKQEKVETVTTATLGEDSDESDWKNSPNISIGSKSDSGSESSSESENEVDKVKDPVKSTEGDLADDIKGNTATMDSGETGDPKAEVLNPDYTILKGRTYNKPTRPDKPKAPVKRKSEEMEGSAEASESKKCAEKDNQEQLKIKMSFKRPAKEAKEYSVKCVKRNINDGSEQEIRVNENGEEIYKNSISQRRKKESKMVVNVGDLVPEGNIKTTNVQLILSKGAEVELNLKYWPSEN